MAEYERPDHLPPSLEPATSSNRRTAKRMVLFKFEFISLFINKYKINTKYKAKT